MAEFTVDGDSAMCDDEYFDRQMVDVAVQLDEEELNQIFQEDGHGVQDQATENQSKNDSDTNLPHQIDDQWVNGQGHSESWDGNEINQGQGQEDGSKSQESYGLEQTSEGQLDVSEGLDQNGSFPGFTAEDYDNQNLDNQAVHVEDEENVLDQGLNGEMNEISLVNMDHPDWNGIEKRIESLVISPDILHDPESAILVLLV